MVKDPLGLFTQTATRPPPVETVDPLGLFPSAPPVTPNTGSDPLGLFSAPNTLSPQSSPTPGKQGDAGYIPAPPAPIGPDRPGFTGGVKDVGAGVLRGGVRFVEAIPEIGTAIANVTRGVVDVPGLASVIGKSVATRKRSYAFNPETGKVEPVGVESAENDIGQDLKRPFAERIEQNRTMMKEGAQSFIDKTPALRESAQAQAGRKEGEWPSFRAGLSGAAESLGMMLPAMTHPVVMWSTYGAPALNDLMSEYREQGSKGPTEGQAIAGGLAEFVMQGGVETLSTAIEKRFFGGMKLPKPVKKKLARTLTQWAGLVVKGYLPAAITEMLEETVQGEGSGVIRRILGMPAAAPGEATKQALLPTALSMALFGPLIAGKTVLDTRSRANAVQWAKDAKAPADIVAGLENAETPEQWVDNAKKLNTWAADADTREQEAQAAARIAEQEPVTEQPPPELAAPPAVEGMTIPPDAAGDVLDLADSSANAARAGFYPPVVPPPADLSDQADAARADIIDQINASGTAAGVTAPSAPEVPPPPVSAPTQAPEAAVGQIQATESPTATREESIARLQAIRTRAARLKVNEAPAILADIDAQLAALGVQPPPAVQPKPQSTPKKESKRVTRAAPAKPQPQPPPSPAAVPPSQPSAAVPGEPTRPVAPVAGSGGPGVVEPVRGEGAVDADRLSSLRDSVAAVPPKADGSVDMKARQRVLDEWKAAPEAAPVVHHVASIDDLPNDVRVNLEFLLKMREMQTGADVSGDTTGIGGLRDPVTGETWIIGNSETIERHEDTHGRVARLGEAAKNKLLDSVYERMKRSEQAKIIADTQKIDTSTQVGQRILAEELLAYGIGGELGETAEAVFGQDLDEAEETGSTEALESPVTPAPSPLTLRPDGTLAGMAEPTSAQGPRPTPQAPPARQAVSEQEGASPEAVNSVPIEQGGASLPVAAFKPGDTVRVGKSPRPVRVTAIVPFDSATDDEQMYEVEGEDGPVGESDLKAAKAKPLPSSRTAKSKGMAALETVNRAMRDQEAKREGREPVEAVSPESTPHSPMSTPAPTPVETPTTPVETPAPPPSKTDALKAKLKNAREGVSPQGPAAATTAERETTGTPSAQPAAPTVSAEDEVVKAAEKKAGFPLRRKDGTWRTGLVVGISDRGAPYKKPPTAQIMRVIDGDTIQVNFTRPGGKSATEIIAVDRLREPAGRQHSRERGAQLAKLSKDERKRVTAAAREFDDTLKNNEPFTDMEDVNAIESEPFERNKAMAWGRHLKAARRVAANLLGESEETDMDDPQVRARLLPALQAYISDQTKPDNAQDIRDSIAEIKAAPDDNTITAGNLIDDDLLYKDGEWYKVDLRNNGVIRLQDGTTTDLDAFDTLSIAGILSKDDPGYEQAAAEHEAQTKAEKKLPSTRFAPKTGQGELLGQDEGGLRLVQEDAKIAKGKRDQGPEMFTAAEQRGRALDDLDAKDVKALKVQATREGVDMTGVAEDAERMKDAIRAARRQKGETAATPKPLPKSRKAPVEEAKAETPPAPAAPESSREDMIAVALRWQGAHINAETEYEARGDKRGQYQIAKVSGKSMLDDYLMKRFGVDRGTAHEVTNHITQQNLAADKTAKVDEFAGEEWADKTIADRSPAAPATPPAVEQAPSVIEDFGEKIGGARKDTAERGFSKMKRTKADDGQPAWRKQYVTAESIITPGQWAILKSGDKYGLSSRRGQTFSSEAEAEAAIPLYAVAESHSVYRESNGKHAIYKMVSKRKRIKVVAQEFASREDGMKYMATHAEELLNMKTNFGEEILPVPEIAIRTGTPRRTTDATPEMFMETFAPRGIEFGNWNNQEERQLIMNHAYDGLMDVADALGLPPKALMLNGELAIAFGARGHGLASAKAHYEPDYGVINLTKMKGAGSLAHEWMHALDHYLARMDTKASSEKTANERGDMVYPVKSSKYNMESHGRSYKSQIRTELQTKFDDLVRSLYKKAQQYVEDTTVADTFLSKAKESLREQLDAARNSLSQDMSQYHKSRGGYSSKSIKFLQPATADQLAEFDRLADTLMEGGNLDTEYRHSDSKKMTTGGRYTNDTLESMNAIFKASRNQSGFRKEGHGALDRVGSAIRTYRERLRLLEDAKTGTEKTKQVTTNFAIEAKKMDQARSSDYWSEPHEMAARAFASYVEDKIAESGGRSDFLVYHAHGGIILPMIDGFVARPYPEGAERTDMNAMFDSFVKEIKTRETERGVAMYSDLDTAPPAFYSALERAVASLPANTKAPGDQFLKRLEGLRNKGQAWKQQEAEESGFADWLTMQREQGQAVTREAALAFLEGNGVRVEEVRKGQEVASGPQFARGFGQQIAEYRDLRARRHELSREEYERYKALQDDLGEEGVIDADGDIAEGETIADSTKFSEYAPPGGEPGTYREVLMTVPEQSELPSGVEAFQRDDGTWDVRRLSDSDPRYSKWNNPDTRNYSKTRDDAIRAFRAIGWKSDNAFTSPHWSEPNVIAHMLMDERRIPLDVLSGTQPELAAKLKAEGKTEARALHMIEGQSDWNQRLQAEGKKEQDVRKSEVFTSRAAAERWVHLHGSDNEVNRLNWFVDRLDDGTFQARNVIESGVPNAPFKGDAWKRLVIRKMLAEAVAGDYDLLTWSTGEDRFKKWGSQRVDWRKYDAEGGNDIESLLKLASQMYADSDGPGDAWVNLSNAQRKEWVDKAARASFWTVSAQEQHGGTHDGLNIEEAARERGQLLESKGQTVRTEEDLRKVIESIKRGDETNVDKLTDRIWDRMQTETEGTAMPRKEFFEFLYDQSFRNEASAIVKKMDKGAGVGLVNSDQIGPVKTINGDWVAKNSIGEFWTGSTWSSEQADAYVFDERSQAESLLKRVGDDFHEASIEAHAIPITPAIRAAVSAGQPLYRDVDTTAQPMLQGRSDETTTQDASQAPGGADNANRDRAGLRDLPDRAWRPRLRAAQSAIRARNDFSERVQEDWARVEVDEAFGSTPEFAEAQQYADARGLTAVPITNAPFTGCLYRDTVFIGRANKPAIVTAKHELFHDLVRNKTVAAGEITRRFNPSKPVAREFQRTLTQRYTDRGRSEPSAELVAEEAAAEIFSHPDMTFRDTLGQSHRLIDAFDDGAMLRGLISDMHGVVGQVGARGGAARYSDMGRKSAVTPAQDAEYMRLAEDPEANREALQAMVDEAAKAAGYTVGPVWHGSRNEGFTVFEPAYEANDRLYAEESSVPKMFLESNEELRKMGPLFWFARDEGDASGYADGGETRAFYLRGKIGTYADRDAAIVAIQKGTVQIAEHPDTSITGRPGVEAIIVRDPVRIKSADPITYAPDGTPIPLSERFNPESDDIRYADGGTEVPSYIRDSEVVSETPSPLGPVQVRKITSVKGRGKYFVTVNGKTRKAFYDMANALGVEEALTSLGDANKTASDFAATAERADRTLKVAKSAPSNISVVTLPQAQERWDRISGWYVYPIDAKPAPRTSNLQDEWFDQVRSHGVAGGPLVTVLTEKGQLAAFNNANSRNFTFKQAERLSQIAAYGESGAAFGQQEDSELSGYDPDTAMATVDGNRIIIAKRGLEMVNKANRLSEEYLAQRESESAPRYSDAPTEIPRQTERATLADLMAAIDRQVNIPGRIQRAAQAAQGYEGAAAKTKIQALRAVTKARQKAAVDKAVEAERAKGRTAAAALGVEKPAKTVPAMIKQSARAAVQEEMAKLREQVENARADTETKQKALEDFARKHLFPEDQKLAFAKIRSIVAVKRSFLPIAFKTRERRFDKAMDYLQEKSEAKLKAAEFKKAKEKLREVVGRIKKHGVGHFSAERKEAVKGMLGEFTFKTLKEDQAVREAISELRADDSVSLSDEENREIEKLLAKNVNDMDIDEIRYMTWMLSRILDEQKAARKEANAVRTRAAIEDKTTAIGDLVARKHVDFTKNMPEKSGGFIKAYLSTFLPSRTVAYFVDGGKENGVIQKRFVKAFHEGTRRSYGVYRSAREFIKTQLGDFDAERMQRPTEARPIAKFKRGKTTAYTLESGQKIELYDGERISLYLSSKNDANRRHLTHQRGGVLLSDNVTGAPIKLTEGDLDQIAGEVAANPSLKKIGDAYYQVFNGILKDALNETSNELDAEEIADEPDYFPIIVASLHRVMQNLDESGVVPGDIESIARFTIESMGALKRRLPGAYSPVVLYDVFSMGERATKIAGLYHGYAVPIDMVKRMRSPLMDKEGHEVGTVEGAITKAYGKHYWNAIIDVAKSFEQKEGTSYLNQKAGNALNIMTKGALSWNLPVWLVQAVSYVNALPYMPTKHWMKGLVSRAAGYEEMGKYDPILYMRGLGRATIATGEVIKHQLHGLGEAGMKGILYFDRQAVGRIFRAIQSEERAKDPRATEEQIGKRAALRTDDILWLSQPTFESETRSMAQRNKDIGLRTIMRFSSQRTTLFDMFARAMYDHANGKTSIAKTLEVLGVLFASQAGVAALKTLAGGLYGRREPEENEKYFWRTLVATLASFGGRGLEIIVDVMNSVTTYGRNMQDPFFQVVEDAGGVVWNAGKGAYEVAHGEAEKGMKKLRRSLSQGSRVGGVVTGTGVHNIAEPITAVIKALSSYKESESGGGSSYRTNSSLRAQRPTRPTERAARKPLPRSRRTER